MSYFFVRGLHPLPHLGPRGPGEADSVLRTGTWGLEEADQLFDPQRLVKLVKPSLPRRNLVARPTLAQPGVPFPHLPLPEISG